MTTEVQNLYDSLTTWDMGREWVRVDCPYCVDNLGKDDRKKCLAINTESGWYGCWRCKAKGRVKTEERLLPTGPSPETFVKEPVMALPKGFEPIYPEHGVPARVLTPHRNYLAGRDISREVCQQANLGGVVGDRFWAGRVLVPVDSFEGKLAGWSARAIVPGVEPKYRYPKGFKRATSLFNKSALFKSTCDPVYVVEGVFDALALWPHAVAVLGKPTYAQEEIVAKAKRPVCVALDGDAWAEGWSFAMRLQVRGCNATPVKLPPCEDPASLGMAWLSNAYEATQTDVKTEFER